MSVVKVRDPVAVLATSVLVGVATFLAVLLGLARMARVVTHTLDGLAIWTLITFALAFACAVASFLLVLRRLASANSPRSFRQTTENRPWH